jgi:hypothetical protein
MRRSVFRHRHGGTASLSAFLALFLVLGFGAACGPPSSQGPDGSADSGDTPELTKDIIDRRINDGWVRGVMPESGTGEPINWGFDEDEPKEITVVDQQVNGTRATVVLDIKTESSPRARIMRKLAGQIRTEWELRSGWALRRWEIVDAENISMKYKDFPKPSPSNTPTDPPKPPESPAR